MRIRKKYQVIPTNAKLENGHSTSDKNGYTCEYLNGALDYSTTEQVIGRWIDGKPLYRKVIDFGTLPNASDKTVSIGITPSQINITNAYGIAKDNNGSFLPMNFINTSNLGGALQFQITPSGIYIRTGVNYSSLTAFVVIEYTKTTDV